MLADVESKKALHGKVWKREEQVQREQDIARQKKKDLEELRRQFRSHLFDEEDLQDLKSRSSKGWKQQKFPETIWRKVVQRHRLTRYFNSRIQW